MFGCNKKFYLKFIENLSYFLICYNYKKLNLSMQHAMGGGGERQTLEKK